MALSTVIAAALLAAAGACLAAEFGLRLMGFHRFPLFAADPECGFRMRGAQAGRFRNRVAWSYDEHGGRAPEGVAGPAGAILIVGDSVVEGGLRIAQDETLAAQVARLCGAPAYPLACHGWALANELAALELLPGWRAARSLVMVINTSDLDQVGKMASPLSFPTRPPRLLLPWLVRRQLLRSGIYPRGKWVPGPYPHHALREQNLARLRALCTGFAGRVFVAAYPLRGQDLTGEPHFAELAEASGAELFFVGASEHWTEACYSDHIHPNARGVGALAAIIRERCC